MPTDAIGIYKSAKLPFFLQASLRYCKKCLDALGTTILANHGSRKRSIGECESFGQSTFWCSPELAGVPRALPWPLGTSTARHSATQTAQRYQNSQAKTFNTARNSISEPDQLQTTVSLRCRRPSAAMCPIKQHSKSNFGNRSTPRSKRKLDNYNAIFSNAQVDKAQ